MTKECEVILNNDEVTVVKFDGKEIQFPSIHKNAKTVFVKVDNGTYSIVGKMENESKDSGVQNQKKPRTYKKTTNVEHENSDINAECTDDNS